VEGAGLALAPETRLGKEAQLLTQDREEVLEFVEQLHETLHGGVSGRWNGGRD
jgi:hypothetical protein